MAIEVIGKIKQKNNGTFALLDASDVELPSGERLDSAVERLEDKNTSGNSLFFIGSNSEYKVAYESGAIQNNTLVIITDDVMDDTTAILGQAILGKMVLGTN